jgi:hypothetical protein
VAHIHSNFGWIAHSIKKLENTGLSLQESMDILENVLEMKILEKRNLVPYEEKFPGSFEKE